MIQSLSKNLVLIICSLVIVSCGGGGGGGGTTTPVIPAPTINLSAAPTSVLLENTSTLTWSSNNATSCSASWTTQTGTSGSEPVTINIAGNNSFSISCAGDGGTRSASVTVEGYRNTDGVVVDGYISGAEVCIDENDNWTCDSSENSTTSDNEGKFTIRYANGNLVSIGGTDLDSQTLLDNLLITHKLTGHSDFKAVTPVTSVAAFMEDASLVNAALGIDSSIDVFTFDPVANKGDGGINNYLYEKGNQLTVLAFALQNITNNLNTTTETTQDFFKAITEEIEKEYTETETKVDIETEAFVIKALDNVIAAKSITIDETAKANATKVLSGILPIIQVKSSDDLTTSVIRFAVSTLQTDIQTIANGSATSEMVTSYTEDLLTYIAEDQNIDSGEIAPDINTIADSVLTSEDTEIEINVLLNDSYVTSSPFSLSTTNGTNGSTSISNNLITYSPDADYHGSDSFSYTLTQGEKTSSADVTVTIEAVNDEPTIDIASTIQVQENQTAVTTVSVSDVDEDELTLTLGGTDADSFDLSNDNVLTFKEAPDYETKTSYSITLTVSDGTVTVPKDVTIVIIDINDAAPVFTSGATFSAEENQTTIGTVTATDPEGDSFNFSILGTELEITPAGVLTFASAPDYETKATYTDTVTVVDTEGNSATQDIAVNVTNVNDNSPVFTSGATFSAEENQTTIGTVTVADADGDDVTFSVSGTELEITSAGVLTFASAPDYETKSSYTTIVTASDGTNIITQAITVNVTDVNDIAPVFTSSPTFSAAENQTAIATVTATDPEDDLITFIVSGSELAITSAGVLTFASEPNYETKASYTAIVTASDGINTTPQEITVNIIDVTEVVAVDDSASGIEDLNLRFDVLSNDTFISSDVTLTATDGTYMTVAVQNDASGYPAVIYSPDDNWFGTDTFTYTVSSGGESDQGTVTVTVASVNDTPIITSEPTFSAAENQTAIGTVTATDIENDTLTYSISGSDISIDPSTGVMTFVSAPDYETTTLYSATVTVSDGTDIYTQDITVNITNVNDNSPVISSSANFNANENQKVIGTVTASDADMDGIVYSILSSDITIDTSSGDIEFNASPDFETKNSYSATVTVTDGSFSASQEIVVNINDIPEETIQVSVAANNNGSGNVYVINGTQRPALDLVKGVTYTFVHPSGHPLRFSQTANGIHGGGSQFYSDVNTDTNGITIIKVSDITPESFYYYCSIHPGMGNAITRTDTVLNNPPVASSASYYLNLLPQDQSSTNITLDATDEDGDSLTYSVVSDASYGTTSISGSTLTYLTNPSTQSAQTESFSFKANDGTVDSKAVTITIDLKTDPLYQHQWHLNNTGQTNFATNAGTVGQDLNVDSVIADGITGNGIKISIVDDGLEIAHEDLIDNVITGSWNFIDSGTDPTQSSSFTGGGHGTSVGGIIAAKGWNNKGVRGIAPNASIFGYNFLEVGFSSQHDQSLGVNPPSGVTADIYNMSYGAAYGFGANEYNLPSYLSESQEQKFINGTSNLRDNKGALYLWAAGNEFNDASITDFCGRGEPLSCTEISIDSKNATPYIIAVGALDANGLKTTYSTPGAGLWVSGFGGEGGYNSDIYPGSVWEDGELDPAVMTIDRSGCVNGYSSGVDGNNYSGTNTFDIGGYGFSDNENLNSTCSYFSTFGGTSAAAPTAAGVVALMLEANPNLTWRDVKHILVTTSDKVDANRNTSLAGISQYDWITNAAGHEHHNWYGFGKINANAAVSAALSYTADGLGEFIDTGYLAVSPNSAIEDGQATTSTIEVTKPTGSNGIVEFVRVSLSFNHPAAWSVGVRLQSPSGTIVNLMQPNTNIANPEDTLFDIGASAFYGESMDGTWTIQLIDYYTENTGTFNTFGIQIYGN